MVKAETKPNTIWVNEEAKLGSGLAAISCLLEEVGPKPKRLNLLSPLIHVRFTSLLGLLANVGIIVQIQPSTPRERLLLSCLLRLQVTTGDVESSLPQGSHCMLARRNPDARMGREKQDGE
jgi:hypothetical protein